MKNPKHHEVTRRSFLRQCMSIGLGSTGAMATLSQLQLAHAQTAATGEYKALVCIFLFGGNDSFNMVIPRETNAYDTYAASRQNLAIPQADLLPISAASQAYSEFGLHPSLTGLQSLYNQKKAAFLVNTGSLIQPVTKTSYQNKSAILPPQLFSHNDQQKFMQSLQTKQDASGWSGRAADVMASMNANSRLSMNVSMAGSNLWQSGNSIIPYSVSPAGVQTFTHLSPVSTDSRELDRVGVLQRILDQGYDHKLAQAYAQSEKTAWNLSEEVSAALSIPADIQTAFPENNKLATSLKMTAKMLAARDQLSMTRQTFFIGMGGFDTHGSQAYHQPLLMTELNDALTSFYSALEELGLENNVTVFTASDFGRTLTSNGDGTDHAWGGHQLILGGSVKGGDIYGTMPSLDIGGDDDIGEGRIIPTTSADQYGATLTRWFGLPTSAYGDVFPNLVNFSTPDIGFMNV